MGRDALIENEQKITLTVEQYLNIVDKLFLLSCLRDAGVDNWEGYAEAMEIYNDNEVDFSELF